MGLYRSRGLCLHIQPVSLSCLLGRFGGGMNKPISIAIKETRQGICDVINTSGLPISVIELIVSDVYGEVQLVARKQLEQDVLRMENKDNAETGA